MLPPETYFDMRLPILVGEIAYNLRSALDYLVFELARLDTGIEQSGTQFPLEDTPEGFQRNLKRGRLIGLNAAHIAAIEGMLRDLSNPDKHRHLIKASGEVGFTVHSSLEKDLSSIVGYERYADHPVPGQPPVKVKVHLTANHTFDDGSPVIESIEEIEMRIGNALGNFKPDS
jgi:hypothetical protein